jgi:phosphatidylglycerophosphate synthase
MPDSKQLADIITWSRVLLAPLLIWLGLTYGPEALPAVVVLMVANLTADSIDGPLARRSPERPQTWIGENDLAVDMLVNAGVMGYLTAAGFIPWQATGLYVILWALIFRWRGGAYALGIIFQIPIYLSFIFVILRDAAPFALVFAGWILAALIASWPKFPKVMVPGFLDGVRDMIGRRRHPRDIS